MTCLAIDIGASSGRHIVGWRDKAGVLQTREVYRFPNGMDEVEGHLVWDTERLEREVRTGIDRALERFPDLVSLSIDTWGGGLCAPPWGGAGQALLCLPGRPHRSGH